LSFSLSLCLWFFSFLLDRNFAQKVKRGAAVVERQQKRSAKSLKIRKQVGNRPLHQAWRRVFDYKKFMFQGLEREEKEKKSERGWRGGSPGGKKTRTLQKLPCPGPTKIKHVYPGPARKRFVWRVLPQALNFTKRGDC